MALTIFSLFVLVLPLIDPFVKGFLLGTLAFLGVLDFFRKRVVMPEYKDLVEQKRKFVERIVKIYKEKIQSYPQRIQKAIGSSLNASALTIISYC